jgi:ACS family tartrate transporter-like MFS transporter
MVGTHIAVINSIGNLGGFVGPVSMGWLHQLTQNYVAGLASVAICMAFGALITWQLSRPSLKEIAVKMKA